MKKRWRSRCFIFSGEDVAHFDAAIKSAFPQLRILRHHYWTEQEKRQASQYEPAVPYRHALSSADAFTDHMQEVWLQPEDWRPTWLPPDKTGYRHIVNTPRLAFTWYRPLLHGGSWFDDRGPWRLSEGRVTAHYADGDKEHLAFINRICRMITRFSTNTTPWCYHDLSNGQIRGPYVANDIWIGYGALEWVRQDPRRCFHYCHRPADSIGLMPSGA